MSDCVCQARERRQNIILRPEFQSNLSLCDVIKCLTAATVPFGFSCKTEGWAICVHEAKIKENQNQIKYLGTLWGPE